METFIRCDISTAGVCFSRVAEDVDPYRYLNVYLLSVGGDLPGDPHIHRHNETFVHGDTVLFQYRRGDPRSPALRGDIIYARFRVVVDSEAARAQ